MIVIAQGVIPEDLANAWLQHLRNFDMAHPGCHFEVMIESGDQVVPVRKMVEILKISPSLSVLEVYERAKKV